ncbi:MAG: hypothetical protein M3O09_14540 [Acidobacteriota bacterium]|nr:hypothetical protein [Acidobacteriota bacterium]
MTSATISLAAAPATLLLKPDSTTNNATGHIFVRNDGTASLSNWCAVGHFTDFADLPQKMKLGLGGGQLSDTKACQELMVNPGAIEELTLSIQVSGRHLPSSGVIVIGATGQSTLEATKLEDRKDQREVIKKSKSQRTNDGYKVKDSVKKVPCRVNAKEVFQAVVMTPSNSASHAWCTIWVTALVALGFLVSLLVTFSEKLSLPMGSSQWSFTSSAATNLTVVGSLLGTVLASSALPEYPHYMTKQSYVVLSLLFAVLAGLSPVVYNFFCKPVGPNKDNPQLLDFQGWVWLFLAADALTVWAVAGQLSTLGLLFHEFAAKQHISGTSAWIACAVASMLFLSLLSYCARTAKFYISDHPLRVSADSLAEARREGNKEAIQTATPPPPRWIAP